MAERFTADRPPEQADRADEIAAALAGRFCDPMGVHAAEKAIAAVLRSYRNGALEEAARHCDGRAEVIRQVRRKREYPKETAAVDAAGIRQAGFCARVIRSLKSKEATGK